MKTEEESEGEEKTVIGTHTLLQYHGWMDGGGGSSGGRVV